MLMAKLKITCPTCENTTEGEYEVPPMYNFYRLLEFVADGIAICPCCGSSQAGISAASVRDTVSNDSFDIPIYKGPLGG